MPLETADDLYDAIRNDADDVQEISVQLDLKRVNVEKVKDHLFLQEHWLDLYEEFGVPGEWRRFDSDRGIAAAWERLRRGCHGPTDRQLLRHEAAEAWFMRKHGPSYRLAHQAAQTRLRWTTES